jgi:NADH-quinone oxidoreductase subunit G
VVLAGERLATSPGALDAVVALAERSGARWAWVPRRAGDRGAVEAGCLPLAGGRDADAIVAGVLAGGVRGLLVGGVDPDDTSDPAAFLAALDAAEFVVSLELRESEVTRRADVVLPVATVAEKEGTFVTWEGRHRPFPRVFDLPASYSDARVLSEIARRFGGLDTVSPGGSTGSTNEEAAERRRVETTGSFRLSSWRLMLDNARMLDGDKALAATARPAVALLSPANLDRFGETVTVTGDRGSVTLPAQAADLADDVVWLPAKSLGRGLLADVASPGSSVEVERA